MIKIKYTFIFYILAIFLLLFGIFFNKNYFIYINSKRLTPTMTAILWIGQITWIFSFIFLLFFQKIIISQRKKIAVGIGSIIIVITVIEIILSIIDLRPQRFSPHQYLNYIGTPYYKSSDGKSIHNSLGLRGPDIIQPKPANTIRLVIIGGSTVYEEAVADWRNDFARQLERELRQKYTANHIEVINAGLPGWTSWENLIDLEFRILPLSPDLVIFYPGPNDIHARFVDPASFKSDNSGKVRQWQNKPCLFIFCLKIMQKLTAIDPESFEVTSSSQFLPNEIPYDATRLGLSPIEILDKNPPVFFENNIRNMIAVARTNNIKFMLSTTAYSNRFSDYAATPYYQRGFAENNKVVEKVASQLDIPVYDFAAYMPMEEKYWADGRHNNEEGVVLKANLFADFIIQNRLIDSRL